MRARSAKAGLELVRWPNALMAALGVLFGAWWVGWNGDAFRPIVLATLAALPLTAAANAWNDAADARIDRVAHPDRPIPSGRLSLATARRVAAVAAIAGVALAAGARPALGALSAVVAALMYAYSPWVKRTGLPGNVLVAALGSLPFLYGGWAAGHAAPSLVLVLVAAPLHLAREIAKDMEDAPADAAVRRTLPVEAGSHAAAAVLAAAALAFLLLLLPFVAARPLFAVAAAPAAALVVHAVTSALRGRRGSPRIFKLAMLCAMLAFLVVRP